MACFLSHLPVTPCSGREAGDNALVCLGKSFPPAAPEDITPCNREAVIGPPPPPLNTLPAWSDGNNILNFYETVSIVQGGYTILYS